LAAGKLVRAAHRLQEILGEDRCAVCGGVAVNAHGFLRGTRDVDVIVAFPLEEARRRLRSHGVAVRLSRGDPLQGDFPCLKGVIDVSPRGGRVEGVPFDVLPQLVPLEPERTLEITVRDRRLRVVDLETLIRLKLKAGGTSDLHDIGVLVHLQPAYMDRAQALAAHDPDLAGRLRSMIDDPRTRAKAREVRRHDTALRAFAAGRGRGRAARGRER